MADSPDKGSTKEPNLELPALFGRRKKKRAREQEEAAAVETPATETDTAPPVDPGSSPEPVDPVIPDPTPEPSPRPEPTPAPEPTPGPEPMPGPEPTPAPEPGPSPEPVPEPGPEPAPVPAGVAEPAAAREETYEETSVLPGLREEPAPVEQTDEQTAAAEESHPAPAGGTRRSERTRGPRRLPTVSPRIAALLAGAITGLVWVALAYVSQRGCETVRGVDSCGGTVGLVALVAILVMMVLLGGYLLRTFGLPDATSTSFLGVGLVAVVAMLFFLESIDSAWMFLVVPALTAATFLLSWWVTETFVEVGSSTDDLHR